MRGEFGGLAMVTCRHGLDTGTPGTEPFQGVDDRLGVMGPGRHDGRHLQIIDGLLPDPGDGEDEGEDEQIAPRAGERPKGARAVSICSSAAWARPAPTGLHRRTALSSGAHTWRSQKYSQQHSRSEQFREPFHIRTDRRRHEVRHDSPGRVHDPTPPGDPPRPRGQRRHGKAKQNRRPDTTRRHQLLPGERKEPHRHPDDECGRHHQPTRPPPVPHDEKRGPYDGEEQPRDGARHGGEGSVGRHEEEPPLAREQHAGGEAEGDTEREGRAARGDVAPEGERAEQGGSERPTDTGTGDEDRRQPGGGQPRHDGHRADTHRGHQVRGDQAVVGGVHPAVPEQVVRRSPVLRREVGPRVLGGEITAAGGEERPPDCVQGERGERREEG